MSAKPRLARKSLAEGSASLVLREMKIEGLRVDPADLATRKGILVQAKPDTAAGVSGMLVKAGDEFGIMYATNIPSKGFKKFSIAHELGHYCIDGHSDALLANGVHCSHAGFRSSDPFEQEADYFAAALLMPELAFRKEMNRYDPGLACIEALRKACETSLTATAIRYAGLTRDGVAVILSSGETVDYCFMSEGLKEAKGISWIRKGTPVPDGTVTSAFNARPENVRTGERDGGDGRLNDWMGGERTYRVREDVLGLGQYGRTLTVLTCEGLSAEKESEYDSEDDELIESWTPKFRK
ncbi:MAG TPA: ImmA/IrrE family metallo-endopeptidase [Rhodopseudomonas sp.]|uniref:ImmA/IrrE family metallo-endopeptidase n=1 Tax=Rhodopseudomonas sp. TaxID=1078 RepID=UPI002ED8E3EF